ncbi:tetratricopeptide repeat protein [Azospirillum agricola]|uniref:tetratricopeptide repeat protein n=1 Tax=Azospirillum agricola TaxID=1720247 RepID=UPI001B3B6392|nr:tetratricopeptide repeat protein [Azospirillum agricola]
MSTGIGSGRAVAGATQPTPAAIDGWRNRIRVETFAGYHYGMGCALLGEGSESQAHEAFRRALDIRPDYPEASHQFAEALQRIGRNAEADQIRRAAAALDPDYEWKASWRISLELFRNSRPEEALSWMEELLSRRSDCPGAHAFVGLIHLSSGEVERAQEALGRSAGVTGELAEELAQEYFRIGKVMFGEGRSEAALVSLIQAAGLSPDFAPTQFMLGCAYRGIRQDLASLGPLRRAIALDPQMTEAMMEMGICLIAIGRIASGAEQLGWVANLVPDRDSAWLNLAHARQRQGRDAEALELHHHAISLGPQNARNHAGLAFTLEELGRIDEAVATYNAALKLDPSITWARNQLEALIASRGGKTAA